MAHRRAPSVLEGMRGATTSAYGIQTPWASLATQNLLALPWLGWLRGVGRVQQAGGRRWPTDRSANAAHAHTAALARQGVQLVAGPPRPAGQPPVHTSRWRLACPRLPCMRCASAQIAAGESVALRWGGGGRHWKHRARPCCAGIACAGETPPLKVRLEGGGLARRLRWCSASGTGAVWINTRDAEEGGARLRARRGFRWRPAQIHWMAPQRSREQRKTPDSEVCGRVCSAADRSRAPWESRVSCQMQIDANVLVWCRHGCHRASSSSGPHQRADRS